MRPARALRLASAPPAARLGAGRGGGPDAAAPGKDGGPMDFIFMLTRQDRTVADCLAVVEEVRSLGLGHIGFKDLGIDRATLAALNRRIKQSGARSCLEVVATDPQAVLRSARTAREIGVDLLLGGAEPEGVLRILQGSGIGYYPFPGRPFDHPTRLGGTADLVERQCRALLQRGCAGVDLLAYRATEAEPLDLVRAARRGLDARRSEGGGSDEGGRRGRLVVAGSIDSPARIQALAAAGADAFTIGSAAFEGRFSPRKGLLRSQLAEILAAARDCPAPAGAARAATGSG